MPAWLLVAQAVYGVGQRGFDRLVAHGHQGKEQGQGTSQGEGLPPDADLIFDLRCLPNPHFQEELRPLSGQNPEVAKFLLDNPRARSYLEQLWNFLRFTFPY
ncbi:MAG: hypothetical protein IH782_09620 [candidate division NC10 bacterium]|nr:hypothetical protein [candidate division NC10 bacterium]